MRLRFGTAGPTGTHTDLSAVRSDGHVLWVAGDETATVERLAADDRAAVFGTLEVSGYAFLARKPG